MLRFFKKHKLPCFIILLLNIINGLVFAFSIFCFIFLYTSAVDPNLGIKWVLIWLGIDLLASLILVAFATISQWYSEIVTERILLDIKFEIINKINFLNYQKINSGDENFISFLSNDIQMLEQYLFGGIISILSNVANLVVMSLVLFYFSWILGVIIIPLIALEVIVTKFFDKVSNRIGEKFNNSLEKYSSNTKVILDGLNTLFFANKIKLLSNLLLKKENKKVASAYVDKAKKQNYISTIISIMSRVFNLGCVIAVVILLSNFNQISFGNFIGVYQLMGTSPTLQVSEWIAAIILVASSFYNNVFNSGIAVTKSLINLKIVKPVVAKINNFGIEAEKRVDFKGDSIDFNIQNMNYEIGDKKLFNNFNFNLQQNQKYAIIGKSGYGKSTLAKLICGFIQPNSGQILINQKSISEYSTKSILDKIGYIEAEPYILKDNIKNNITLYDNNFDEAKYNKIIKLLKLDSIDANLVIDETENDLSVGQKQRINFARYLYKNYNYFILDEALSNLDKETAVLIEDFLLNNKDITFIHISHHLNKQRLSKYNQVLDLETKKIINI
ncbi:MAG: ABC transporter ATP-binding protein [Malacoplasma sp.]|nr:ABC transporter ATP-binding protein [Malacoplasma sp.]